MSDLISRSALIEMLTKYKFGAISNETEREYTKETVLQFVQTAPTAYNVDAVMEQLENAREKEVVSMDKDRNITAVVQKEYIKIDRAIEIVRKGGVK